jgi:hypothetical protein
MERKDGFYWVKFNNSWIVAEWISNKWTFCFDTNTYEDNELNEIDENIIQIDNYNITLNKLKQAIDKSVIIE